MSNTFEQANFEAVGDRLVALLATQMYYPCVLLTNTDIAKLHLAARFLLSRFRWTEMSVGGVLCAALLDVSPKHRSRVARRTFAQEIERRTPGPILCTDIDLMFDPSLELEPLQLLREASRQTPLVVLWPGDNKDWVLSYAVPGHPHYRTWRQTELCNDCIIRLQQEEP